jgi:hypothetical protein
MCLKFGKRAQLSLQIDVCTITDGYPCKRSPHAPTHQCSLHSWALAPGVPYEDGLGGCQSRIVDRARPDLSPEIEWVLITWLVTKFALVQMRTQPIKRQFGRSII